MIQTYRGKKDAKIVLLAYGQKLLTSQRLHNSESHYHTNLNLTCIFFNVLRPRLIRILLPLIFSELVRLCNTNVVHTVCGSTANKKSSKRDRFRGNSAALK